MNTHTTFNQELCDQVFNRKSCILFDKSKDSEAQLQELISHIYPQDSELVKHFIHSREDNFVFLTTDSKMPKMWTYLFVTELPSKPLSDFFLPAVSDGACETCEGHGHVVNPNDPTDGRTCPECNGTGTSPTSAHLKTGSEGITPELLLQHGFIKRQFDEIWDLEDGTLTVHLDSCWWWSIDNRYGEGGSSERKLRDEQHLIDIINVIF